MNRPLCKCHAEPMACNGRQPVTGRRKWQCSVRNRQRMTDWYWTAPGLKLAERAMKNRRLKALQRMEARRGAL